MANSSADWPTPVPYPELSERQHEILQFLLELPAFLPTLPPGGRQGGWAQGPSRRQLPTLRAGGQGMGTTRPRAPTGATGPAARWAAPGPP